ncbi:MAG TPA: TIGR00341 family protein [Moraxellaceae bacterium]|nr:TIGR00341 family protein [Moraxellaceae bacterium]
MDNNTSQKRLSFSMRMQRFMVQRFNLREDKADDAEIETRIRDGVELRGATPWILIFAIFVASVGLNVNSAAVIIGAMLISPLMGPIMGAGLGVAVYDFDLVKRSLTNLGIATLISLIVSALYFSLTPLQQAQSELLARTSPTLWDVLIALFGGLAGIVGMTRREKSNVIPGVAIATALMPPVCTAGYGIATGQWNYFGGALYLYTINCVFISLATVVGIRALKLKRRTFTNIETERKVKTALLVLALGTSLPSGYLAIKLVKQEVFKSDIQGFVAREFVFANAEVVDIKINPNKKKVDLSLIGDPVSKDILHNIESKLSNANLEGAKIIVHQAGDNRIDVTALKSSLLSDLLINSQEAVRQRDMQLEKLKSELAARDEVLLKADDVSNELRQLFPEVSTVIFADGVTVGADKIKKNVIYLNVTTRELLRKNTQQRILDWFKVRMKTDAVIIHFDLEGR